MPKDLNRFYAPVLLILCLGVKVNKAQPLFTQTGTDLPWETLIREKAIPIGMNSTPGILGSQIDVNNSLVEQGPFAKFPIEEKILLHTVGNSAIPRQDFKNWSRWYQEDGNTQIMRLFKGEYNVRNTRPLAARIMAHSALHWGQGDWHEWTGRFTFVRAGGGMIFQVFNPNTEWPFMLGWGSGGAITLKHRRGQPEVILGRDMVGKSLDIRVRDNGLNYEVYSGGSKVGTGSYDREGAQSAFYWGMYVGETEVTSDGILLVTGATIDGNTVATQNFMASKQEISNQIKTPIIQKTFSLKGKGEPRSIQGKAVRVVAK